MPSLPRYPATSTLPSLQDGATDNISGSLNRKGWGLI